MYPDGGDGATAGVGGQVGGALFTHALMMIGAHHRVRASFSSRPRGRSSSLCLPGQLQQ